MAKHAPPSRKPLARRRPSLARRALRFVSLVATGSAAVLAAPSILRRFIAGRSMGSPEMVGGGRAHSSPAITHSIDIATDRLDTADARNESEMAPVAATMPPIEHQPQTSRLPSIRVPAHGEEGTSAGYDEAPPVSSAALEVVSDVVLLGHDEPARRALSVASALPDGTDEISAPADAPEGEPLAEAGRPGVLLEWRPADMNPDIEDDADGLDVTENANIDRGVILPWRPDAMTQESGAPVLPPAMVRRRRASRVYYGWVVTVAAAIGFGVSAGIGNWGFGAFVRPLEAEFGWSRGEVSAAASIGMAAILLGSLPVGWWVDRLGARSAIAFGAVGTAIGFVALSQVETLWQFYGVFAVTAFFRTFTTYIPLIAIVGLWFPGSSGRAMGLIMAGLGMGGVVFAPIATGLIEAFGWREAYVILGIIMGSYFLPASLLVMRSPRRSTAAGEKDSAPVLEGWTFGQALQNPAFWLLNLGIGFMWMGQVGFISHAQPLFEWRGYEPETAAAFVSLAALCATLTRLLAGWIYVRMRRPALFSLVVGLVAAAGLANLLPPVSQITLVAFFALWGLGSGAMVLLPPTLTADTYGQRSLGKLLAFTEVVGGFGSVGGPILGGVLFDSTGSYVAPFLVYVLSTLAAGMALVVFVRVHKPWSGVAAREVKAVPLAEPG